MVAQHCIALYIEAAHTENKGPVYAWAWHQACKPVSDKHL